MVFWILTALMCTAVAAAIGLAMLRRASKSGTAPNFDLDIYADQLKEVDRDLARGVLSEDEAVRVRTEVSRRILAADAQLQATVAPAPRAPSKIVILLTLAAVIGGAGGLYTQLGAPGYADLPLKARIAASDEARNNRLTQAEAETRMADIPSTPPPDASAEFLELMTQLRQTVKDRPDDLQGLKLLARNEASLGRAKQAAEAQGKIIALKGDAATASDYAFLADVQITAAGGYVSEDAEKALRAALDINPTQPVARYYLSQYMLQVDRPDSAFRLMQDLLRQSRSDAPWVPSIRAQIEDVAWLAGVNYEAPAIVASSGPSAEEIAASEQMSAEDRQAMIEGMVSQLSERLGTEGGPAQDWARLIRALGVLERYDEARSIFVESLRVFEGREAELDLVRAAGRTVGISENDL